MAKRYIGDAVITIEYVGETPDGRGNYKGTVRAGKHTWRFDELHSGVGGGGDSPEAYDEMAQSAVSFASYYTTHNRGDDAPEWAPPPEVADAIDEAVGYAQRDNGEYEVRRSPSGKAHEEATMHEMREPTPNRDRVHWKGDFSNNPRSGTIEISGDDGYAIVRWDDGKTERVPTSLFSTPRWSVERRGGPRPPPAAGPQPIPAPAPAPTRSAHKPPEHRQYDLHLIAVRPSSGKRHVNPVKPRLLGTYDTEAEAQEAGRTYLRTHPDAWLQTQPADQSEGGKDVEART